MKYYYYQYIITLHNFLHTVYVPVNATGGEDVVSLYAMVGSNAFQQLGTPFNLSIDPSFVRNYTWNIKIRQIDCVKNNDDLKGNVPQRQECK